MFEQFGFESVFSSPLAASAFFGILLGVAFGIAAQRTRFCFRRALVTTDRQERNSAGFVWLVALGVAIAGTQLSVYAGWLDFSVHRFHVAAVPVLAVAAGGLMFGMGAALTRGCASRLTVLAGSGNLRAVMVLFVFAVVAHAVLKGVFAPVRTVLSQFTIDASGAFYIISSPLFSLVVGLVSLASVLSISLRAIQIPVLRSQLLGGITIGVLVVAGWIGTGLVLQDEFDPIAFQTLSFTSTISESLFWSIASTSIGAGFGVGLFSGVLMGSAFSALTRSEFKWESFESPAQTGRYLFGATLMGFGGVLAGGCTVGAGLGGISTLSVSAVLALFSIAVGVIAMNSMLKRTGDSKESPTGIASVA